MENLLGLNMRINCFGDKVSSLHCKIVLLDEQQLVHEVLVSLPTPIHFIFFFHLFIIRCCAPPLFHFTARIAFFFFLLSSYAFKAFKIRYGAALMARSRYSGPNVLFSSALYCSSIFFSFFKRCFEWRKGCWHSPLRVIGRNRSEQRRLHKANAEPTWGFLFVLFF